VYQEIFPLFVYSRFPLLIVTGLASELPSVGGTGVLAFGAVCGLLTVLLTWCGQGHLPQQIAQITVSASFASRFAVNAVVF
ncbi:Slc19a1, partial [Symbiodinium sp. KB8]